MTSEAPILDPTLLEELHGIGALTPAFFDTLSASFVTTGREAVAKIEEACRTRDHDALYRAAHLLKGCAATFGAARLAARASDLEERGRFASALPPDGALADLAELVDAAYQRAREWATNRGLTP